MIKKTMVNRLIELVTLTKTREVYHPKDTCAYKIRLDLMIDSSSDINKESDLCLNCNGHPRECFSYTTLEHVLDFYRQFRGEIR